MSCVAVTRSQRELLDMLVEHETLPVADLEGPVLEELEAWGWVYRWRGRVELTGSGSWHAGVSGKAGLLG